MASVSVSSGADGSVKWGRIFNGACFGRVGSGTRGGLVGVFRPLFVMFLDVSARSLCTAAGAEEAAKEWPRNTHLRHCELAPCQVLNPMGRSGVGSISARDYWAFLGKGDEETAFFSNLHSSDNARRCVGIAQVAEVLDLVCEVVENDAALGLVVKESLLAELKVEAAELKGCVQVLSQMLRSDIPLWRARAIGHCRSDFTMPCLRALEEAAEGLRRWLVKPDSKLRAFVACVSCGGLFFVAQCHEKCARGFIEAGGGSVSAFCAAVASSGEDGFAGSGDDE